MGNMEFSALYGHFMHFSVQVYRRIKKWCQYHASDTPPYANKFLERATNLISGSKKIYAKTLV
jgi:hypothetical protein